jgi:hypothetical protein
MNLDHNPFCFSTSHVSASYDTLLSRSLCSGGDEAEGVMSAPFESEGESIITQPAAPLEIDVSLALRDIKLLCRNSVEHNAARRSFSFVLRRKRISMMVILRSGWTMALIV